MKKLTILVFSFCCSLLSCNPVIPDEILKENNKRFEENEERFGRIANLIKEDTSTFKANTKFQVEDFRGSFKAELISLGIGDIEIKSSPDSCDYDNRIILNVAHGWNIEVLELVTIIYSPCNNITHKGSHLFDNHEHYLGQGNGWFIHSYTQ